MWERVHGRQGTCARSPLVFCSPKCSNKNGSRNYIHRKRAQGVGERITMLYIAERDGWKCHLCGCVVNAKYRAPHRLSAVLDHVIPLALGGTHVRENVKLAHWSCNSRKRTRAMNEQLLLVG